MKYNTEIIELKNFIDEVLQEVNSCSLDNCPYIMIHEYMNHEDYVKYLFNKEGSIKLEFDLSDWGLVVAIDTAEEMYEYNIDFIRNNKEFMYKFIKNILTAKVQVRCCYFGYCRYTFINKKKEILFSCSMCRSLLCSIKIKCSTKIYNEYF